MSELHILIMHYVYNSFYCAPCDAQLKHHQVTHIIPKANCCHSDNVCSRLFAPILIYHQNPHEAVCIRCHSSLISLMMQCILSVTWHVSG